MTWRPAKSITAFLDDLNEAAPKRSKVSDGVVGDPAHQARTSDHNPRYGVVTAVDATQDPAHGAHMGVIAEALRKSKDPRIAYVIWDRRIFDGTHKSGTGGGGVDPWKWRPYTGSDPHTNHLHMSVAWDLKDDDRPWQCFGKDPEPMTDGHRDQADALLRGLSHRTHPLLEKDRRLLKHLRAAVDKALEL